MLTGRGSSEGTLFAIALPPTQWDYYDAELIINARRTTNVNILKAFSTDDIVVPGNDSYHYSVNYNDSVESGLQTKGW